MEVQHRDYRGVKPFRIRLSHAEVHRDDPDNQYNSHVHPECEIYVNLSGDVSFMVENRIYPIFSGSVVITRPYEYHHCVYHSNEPHRHFWILFSSEGNKELLDLFFDRPLGEGNLLTLSQTQLEELTELCLEMIRDPSSEAVETYRFFKLIHLLRQADVSASASEPRSRIMEHAMRFVDEHFSEPLQVAQIAEAVHVSVNTLERHFGERLHMSPSVYLRKKRLAHAAKRLHDGASVIDACQDSGFSDYSNFIALFKKQYGVTPLRYKKRFEGKT